MEAEQERVRTWRYEQLVGVGYSTADAAAIAANLAIDLAVARRLVAYGCPPELAARILL